MKRVKILNFSVISHKKVIKFDKKGKKNKVGTELAIYNIGFEKTGILNVPICFFVGKPDKASERAWLSSFLKFVLQLHCNFFMGSF